MATKVIHEEMCILQLDRYEMSIVVSSLALALALRKDDCAAITIYDTTSYDGEREHWYISINHEWLFTCGTVVVIDDSHRVTISRQAAADIIAWCGAMLADVALLGKLGRSPPEVLIRQVGTTAYTLLFTLNDESRNHVD